MRNVYRVSLGVMRRSEIDCGDGRTRLSRCYKALECVFSMGW